MPETAETTCSILTGKDKAQLAGEFAMKSEVNNAGLFHRAIHTDWLVRHANDGLTQQLLAMFYGIPLSPPHAQH